MLLISLITVILILGLFYKRKCHKFWQNRQVVSTSPNFLFGDYSEMVWGTKMISYIIEDIYKKYPNERFVGHYEFLAPNLLIRDPQLIESILVKDFSIFIDRIWFDVNEKNRFGKHLFILRGKKWKDLRTKLITTFSTNKLKSMLPLMEHCAQSMDSLIRENCEKDAVDVKEIVSRFATDVIGCCVFGLEFNTLADPESEYRKIGKKLFTPTIKGITIGLLRMLLPKLVKLLNLSEMAPDVANFFIELLRQSEDSRKKESFRRNDLMQLMLNIRDQDKERALSEKIGDEEMIDEDVVLSNVFLFYLAGFETTASSLSFCLYELSFHPEYQQRLREEIHTILKTHRNIASYEALKKMTYAEMVISETLRKYPPAGVMTRICSEPYQLPESSLTLAPGDRVSIPIHALQHDDKYYPNPDKFDPERFTPENVAARPPFTYMPFGDGPRMCIAMRFAKLEMKLCLAKIISNYELNPCSKTEKPLQMQTRAILLTPKNGVQLQLRPLTSV